MNEEKLIYASSEKSADMLYFAGMNLPDSIFAFTYRGEKHALISPLEFGRASKESDFDVLHPTSSAGDLKDLVKIFAELGVKKISVPAEFPASIYLKLEKSGLGISVCEGEFFKERRIKSGCEIEQIKKANKAASESFARVSQILRDSKIVDGEIIWQNIPLTSEILKFEIESACLAMGADSKHTIAAAGIQACDPHNEGSGKIRAGELIVVDIFPQMKASGYFGDMTRTFLKGKPSDAQCELVESVIAAQKHALRKIKAGAPANSIHGGVVEFFERHGYKTFLKNGAWNGFFHSTGHGIGLEVHEEPRLGLAENLLRTGEVVTVEPGLYYPEIGACRIEDNVLITNEGCEMLSEYPYDWRVE